MPVETFARIGAAFARRLIPCDDAQASRFPRLYAPCITGVTLPVDAGPTATLTSLRAPGLGGVPPRASGA